MANINSTALPSVLTACLVVGALHILAWLIASSSSCTSYGVGLGGGSVTCSGILPPKAGAAILISSFIGAPILLMILLGRAHQRHAAPVALSAEVVVPVGMALAFAAMPSLTNSGWLPWEATTQLIAIPAYVIALSLLSGSTGKTTP
jgi:hypothetical protein